MAKCANQIVEDLIQMNHAVGNAEWARLIGVVEPETPALRATSFISTEVIRLS